MKEIKIGGLAVSRAGHDLGKTYVIFQMDSEYVYLVDGKNRTVDRPKKKKIKHVNIRNNFDDSLAVKVINRTVRDEEIKKAIKEATSVNLSKEVE